MSVQRVSLILSCSRLHSEFNNSCDRFEAQNEESTAKPKLTIGIGMNTDR